MMLDLSFQEEAAANTIMGAVRAAVADGLRTADIYRGGGTRVSTTEMGDHITEIIGELKGV